jgi:L-threonylcarbamoyladenylate synthase
MADRLAAAVSALQRGELVVYPTDTLLGLGARATDSTAVDRLLAAKDRPAAMPISVAVSSYEELEPLVEWGPAARAVARVLLPGPVTLLVRASKAARAGLAGPLLSPAGTLGVRIPDHPVARALARQVGPLTATSANRHGVPPASNIAEARRSFGRSVAVYLPARPAPSGRPSTLVDLRGPTPRVVPRT